MTWISISIIKIFCIIKILSIIVSCLCVLIIRYSVILCLNVIYRLLRQINSILYKYVTVVTSTDKIAVISLMLTYVLLVLFIMSYIILLPFIFITSINQIKKTKSVGSKVVNCIISIFLVYVSNVILFMNVFILYSYMKSIWQIAEDNKVITYYKEFFNAKNAHKFVLKLMLQYAWVLEDLLSHSAVEYETIISKVFKNKIRYIMLMLCNIILFIVAVYIGYHIYKWPLNMLILIYHKIVKYFFEMSIIILNVVIKYMILHIKKMLLLISLSLIFIMNYIRYKYELDKVILFTSILILIIFIIYFKVWITPEIKKYIIHLIKEIMHK